MRLGQDFTKVTFYPDLKRFGMTKLDKDHDLKASHAKA